MVIAQNNGAKYLFAVMKRHPDLKEVIQEILCFVRIAWTIKYTCIGVRQNTAVAQQQQMQAAANGANGTNGTNGTNGKGTNGHNGNGNGNGNGKR